ncbi:hypothetical protein H696_02167 [Fonticula alba]|uniref:Glycosyltransferase 61 catalytic domain-containing protein n=1 Tax=Fonticula alba TaxID=691883 RepID=A0A058ZBA8_FONAL|nr:hypothetical protein H696_02167 [Fonticula alba]KCV71216.1 hypothetical protein H696_02167 [Fonticula alba]|eukprot:XP_009494339.1 hypothetical protein H696_02167 [Fonticula alba]
MSLFDFPGLDPVLSSPSQAGTATPAPTVRTPAPPSPTASASPTATTTAPPPTATPTATAAQQQQQQQPARDPAPDPTRPRPTMPAGDAQPAKREHPRGYPFTSTHATSFVDFNVPGSTTAHIFDRDPKKMRVCAFQNICLNSTHAFFLLEPNPADKVALPADVDRVSPSSAGLAELKKDLALCSSGVPSRDLPLICQCFTRMTKPVIVSEADMKALRPTVRGHHWLIDKFVSGNQIGHWAESLGFFHSIVMNKEHFGFRVMNEEVIERLLRKYGVRNIARVTTTKDTPTKEQASLFYNSGLILSPHSSQLVNLVFTPANASIIEMAPAYFNSDFSQIAEVLTQNYHFVIGGYATGDPVSLTTEEKAHLAMCNARYAYCNGRLDKCSVRASFENIKDHQPKGNCSSGSPAYAKYSKAVKSRDFYVDEAGLERAIKSALYRLHQACGGSWPGADPAALNEPALSWLLPA